MKVDSLNIIFGMLYKKKKKKKRCSPLRKVDVAVDRQFHLVALEGNIVAKVSCLAINLYAFLKVLFLRKPKLKKYIYDKLAINYQFKNSKKKHLQ